MFLDDGLFVLRLCGTSPGVIPEKCGDLMIELTADHPFMSVESSMGPANDKLVVLQRQETHEFVQKLLSQECSAIPSASRPKWTSKHVAAEQQSLVQGGLVSHLDLVLAARSGRSSAPPAGLTMRDA